MMCNKQTSGDQPVSRTLSARNEVTAPTTHRRIRSNFLPVLEHGLGTIQGLTEEQQQVNFDANSREAHAYARRRSLRRHKRHVSLADLTLSLDDEVEGAFIRALEKREEEQLLKARTPTHGNSWNPLHSPEITAHLFEEKLSKNESMWKDGTQTGETCYDNTQKHTAGNVQSDICNSNLSRADTVLVPRRGSVCDSCSSTPIRSSTDVIAKNASIILSSPSEDPDETPAVDIEAQNENMSERENGSKDAVGYVSIAKRFCLPLARLRACLFGPRVQKKYGVPAADMYSTDDSTSQRKGDDYVSGFICRVLLAFSMPINSFMYTFEIKKHVVILFKHAQSVILWLGVPLLGTAAILFYLFGNPMTRHTGASYSWWLIFTFRQVMTLSLARASQFLLVDSIFLRTKVALKMFGPFITLATVQSRGWPFTVTFWALWNVSILFGEAPFANHWLFWQESIKMYNSSNPSGGVLSSQVYESILIAAIVTGVLTSMKRSIFSFYLGRKTCEHYGPQLKQLMDDTVLIGKLSILAKDIEELQEEKERLRSRRSKRQSSLKQAANAAVHMWPTNARHLRCASHSTIGSASSDIEVSDDANTRQKKAEVQQFDEKTRMNSISNRSTNPNVCHNESKSTSKVINDIPFSERHKLIRLLDQWEEPRLVGNSQQPDVSIHDILHFRNGMSHLAGNTPFSSAFGLANTRENCIESAQDLYERLLTHTPQESILPFETIFILALDDDCFVDMSRGKALTRLFRPDRKGQLSLLDFVKSCDQVYRRVRMLRAAVDNSSSINNAYENLASACFYCILTVIVLVIMRIDPWRTLVGLSSLIVSFAFAFGNAVSKFTEGVLLVTVRKPFDIGDRIHISDPNQETSTNGSYTWFVENITLFTTTLRFAFTNEVCTIANGSLANSRIVNGARSPNAQVHVFLKFGTDVPYERVQHFRTTVESFVKARPREWSTFDGFRATRVEADHGYVEYVVVLKHREPWQNMAVVVTSKAELSSFCLEVSKKLGMRYVAPPLPVQLDMKAVGMGKSPVEAFGEPPPLPNAGKEIETDTEDNSCSSDVPPMQDIHDMFKENKKTKHFSRGIFS